jgi:hypothetical protein
LPEFYRGLLVRPRGQSPEPEHAGAEVRLRGTVIKEKRRLAAQLGRVEGVGHEQEDIDVVGIALARNERPEDDESRQVAGRLGDAVDACEPESQGLALVGPNAEAANVQAFIRPARRTADKTSWISWTNPLARMTYGDCIVGRRREKREREAVAASRT